MVMRPCRSSSLAIKSTLRGKDRSVRKKVAILLSKRDLNFCRSVREIIRKWRGRFIN